MSTLDNSKIWAPTQAELRQIERQARYERAKASRMAFRYLARKISGLFSRRPVKAEIQIGSDHVTG